MSHDAEPGPRIGPLAKRLILLVILFSSLVTCITTGVQLYVDYSTERSAIDDRVAEIEQSHLPALTHSVWVANDEKVLAHLQGLLRLPDLEHLAIEVDGAVAWQVGKRVSDSQVARSFTI